MTLRAFGQWKRLHRAGATQLEATMPTNQSKTATITKLLRRPKGASIAQLQSATSWQAHSIRGALSRMGKQGHSVTHSGRGKTSRYHLSSDDRGT